MSENMNIYLGESNLGIILGSLQKLTLFMGFILTKLALYLVFVRKFCIIICVC